MSAWTNGELERIAAPDELETAPLRQDGTLRRPVTIWDVRVDDDLYVRSVNGRTAAWYRGAQTRHEGRIWAGGVEKDVTFVDIDTADSINGAIDAAYRTKYRRYAKSIVDSIIAPQARDATFKVVPRS